MPAAAAEIVCWKCGAPLAALPVPFARQAECPTCRADVHVCRQCRYYDTRVARSCREPVAEEVQDKERANFCGYFQAAAGAYAGAGRTQAGDAARAQLDALFGVDSSGRSLPANNDEARQALDELFGTSPRSGK